MEKNILLVNRYGWLGFFVIFPQNSTNALSKLDKSKKIESAYKMNIKK